MRKKATGRDVAERAGVSLTTVSLVLNRHMNAAIPEETRQRVLEAARQLGYRPNSLVRSLVRGRTQTIGVVVPRLDSSFHAAVVQGIQTTCAEHGYRILLADSEHRFSDECTEVELLLQHRADGLISVALPDDVPLARVREWARALVADGVAMVVVDDHSIADIVDCVVTDDVRGSEAMVHHLLELGHRTIAHLSAGDSMSSARDRLAGYRLAVEKAGLAFEPTLVAGHSYFMTPSEIRLAFRRLLDHDPAPTALFAANDDLAAECIGACRDLGLAIPDDLSVAGYGDTAAGHYLDITTVQQDPLNMGRRAAERLLERLEKPDLPPSRIVLPVEPAVRRTTSVPPAGGIPARHTHRA